MSLGRPEIPIDWDKVDALLEAECRGTEVAAAIGVHHDTFYNRITAEKGMLFSEYAAKLRAKGNSSLRAKQVDVALSGNTTMLIWLGKNRLEQKENPNAEENPNDAQMTLLGETIKMLHANNQKIKELEEKLAKYEPVTHQENAST